MTVRPSSVALFAGILAAQFAVFEAGLRVWGSSEAAPSFQGLFTGDPVIGYRLKPNARTRFTTSEFDVSIDINSLGVRDDEEIGVKPPNERRIVVLGDSLVLSVQVPLQQTFCELLERRLNARATGIRYRVINAGVQGYGPVEELLFFRLLAARLQPDVVLHAIFVGNDAEEALSSAPKLAGDQRPRADVLRESIVTRLRRLVRNSMVLQVLRLRVLSATERFGFRMHPPEAPLQSYAANPAPRIQTGIQVTRQCVEEVAKHAAALGARAGIVLMPARFQVNDADFEALSDVVRQAGGQLVRDAATERFDAAFAQLPLPRVDVLPALRAHTGTDVFFLQTVHLTPRGHEIVADTIDKFLHDTHLVEEGAGPSIRVPDGL